MRGDAEVVRGGSGVQDALPQPCACQQVEGDAAGRDKERESRGGHAGGAFAARRPKGENGEYGRTEAEQHRYGERPGNAERPRQRGFALGAAG